MKQQIKKRFDLIVKQANSSNKVQFDLDKNITNITGLLMSSDRDDLLFYRGSQKIEINNEEIVPENYESKLLLSGINVAPNQRYYTLRIQHMGNRILKVEYQDSEDGRNDFTPYRVSVYLDCEIEN